LGVEIAGVIVELPTDESVLNNGTYKSKNLAIGCKVASVRVLILFGRVHQLTIEWKELSWYPCNVCCSPMAKCLPNSRLSLH
jgi:hypothetical protein